MSSTKPIGVFDSGLGGLTIVNAIQKALSQEKIIYFGDTAHLPYGDKSKKTIKKYSYKIAKFLVKKRCKLIVIACNSASATAYNYLKKKFPNVIVLDVISPLILHLKKDAFLNSSIGVIGTSATINSGVYQRKISKTNRKVKCLATPLLVPLIEENIKRNLSQPIIDNYLKSKQLSTINHLVLGCTHYPLIKNQIKKYYNKKVSIIDAPSIMSSHVKKVLKKKKIENKSKIKPRHSFFVSDLTSNFENSTEKFLKNKINLIEYKL